MAFLSEVSAGEAIYCAERVSTLLEAFNSTVSRKPDAIFVKTPGDEATLSWQQTKDQSVELAAGFQSIGVKHGDVVAMLMLNRIEFYPVDLGLMTLGAAPVSIYMTASPDQIAYVLKDSGAQVIVTEKAFLPQLKAAVELAGGGHKIVSVDDPADSSVMTLEQVKEAGKASGFDLAAAEASVKGDDLLTLIYTSGTTGDPKGVELTHSNVISASRGMQRVLNAPLDGCLIGWLPAAHIAERAANYYGPLIYGHEVTVCADPRQIVAILPQTRPTWFFAPPRIWEKIKAALETRFQALPDEQRVGVEGALAAAKQKVDLVQSGQPVPAEMEQKLAAIDAQVFAPIRAQLGLDRCDVVLTGAAPTPYEVIAFFHAIGLPLGEIWGMSETCASGTLNPPERIKIGSVGPALPNVEIKLAEDGELLLRGPGTMRGYRNKPEKTAEAIDADGWYYTGDVGTIDEDGYIRIVDRKKELIINSSGKNMSPANIEAAIKTADPLIGQACVIGDGRPFNVALIVLDADFAPLWAQQHGIDGDLASLAENPMVIEAVQAGVDKGNANLSRVEQIKKFKIIAGDWLPGGDELTPTMKLKRSPISEKYTAEIAALYS